jgi:hypothetical protein
MNTSINLIIKAAAPNSPKGTTFSYKTLKTQTNLEISYEKKDQAAIDFPEALAEDLAALGFKAEPIGPITVIVSDAQAIGKLHNRSVKAFSRIGIKTAEIGWDDDGGLLEFTIEGGTVLDLPAIVDVLSRMTFRATVKFTSTRHPLSLFDLKQTCGLTNDAKDGLGKAQDTLDWFSVKELAILEEEKRVKAEEKAKTAAAKAQEKAKEKAESKPDTEAKEMKKAAAKAAKATKKGKVQEADSPNE